MSIEIYNRTEAPEEWWVKEDWDDNGPFTRWEAYRFVRKRLCSNPDVVVMGKSHTLGRESSATRGGTYLRFVVYSDKAHGVVDGPTTDLLGLWDRWFDRMVSDFRNYRLPLNGGWTWHSDTGWRMGVAQRPWTGGDS